MRRTRRSPFRRMLGPAAVAAAVVGSLGLSACDVPGRVDDATAATWATVTGGYRIVGNATAPAAYRCNAATITWEPIVNGLRRRGDCAAHFQGTGIVVAVPEPCVDGVVALDGSPGPMVVVVRDRATGASLRTVSNAWTSYRMQYTASASHIPPMNRLPINLYFAHAGAGTLTSGFQADDGSHVEALPVPRLSRSADTYRVQFTCDAKNAGSSSTTRRTITVDL